MTKNSLRTALLGLAVLCLAGPARAGLIFDNYTPNSALFGQTSFRDPEAGPLTFLSIRTTTEISQIGVLNRFNADGQIKFLIADGDGNLLYQSATTSVSAAPQGGAFSWKLSDTFSFTLEAGRSYYIGYLADVATDLPFAGSATGVEFSQNGITSPAAVNGNATGFADPRILPETGTGVIPLRLFSGGTTPAVPEPSSVVLLGAGASVLGIASIRRRSA